MKCLEVYTYIRLVALFMLPFFYLPSLERHAFLN